MKEIITRQADQLTKTLFKSPPQDWCFVVVPSKNHVTEVFQRLLDVADPATHSRASTCTGSDCWSRGDIGESLRHEFAHRMHWADMDLDAANATRCGCRKGSPASTRSTSGPTTATIKFVPNMRHNIARRQVQAGIALSWDKLFDLETQSQFLAGNARFYPQVRSMFEFLAALGLLEEWYDAYVADVRPGSGGRKGVRTGLRPAGRSGEPAVEVLGAGSRLDRRPGGLRRRLDRHQRRRGRRRGSGRDG